MGGRNRRTLGWAVLLVVAAVWETRAADSPRVLVGSWAGKAAGPQGAPPTGDLTVTFKNKGTEVVGRMVVRGQGGSEYAGDVSGVSIRKGVFAGTATLKLGENPLTVEVTGPLKGKTIEGTFSVSMKGQKMGDGTFTISKLPRSKPAP